MKKCGSSPESSPNFVLSMIVARKKQYYSDHANSTNVNPYRISDTIHQYKTKQRMYLIGFPLASRPYFSVNPKIVTLGKRNGVRLQYSAYSGPNLLASPISSRSATMTSMIDTSDQERISPGRIPVQYTVGYPF